MKRIFLKKEFQKLVPADQESLEYVNKLKFGEVYGATLSKPRNYPFLQKYMVMIRVGWEATTIANKRTGKQIEFDAYREYMQVLAGFVDVYADGGFLRSKSISFANMSEDEFAKVYEAVKSQVAYDIGTNDEELELEVLTRF